MAKALSAIGEARKMPRFYQIHANTDAAFKQRLRLVAAAKNTTMGELILQLITPGLDREYEAIRIERKGASPK